MKIYLYSQLPLNGHGHLTKIDPYLSLLHLVDSILRWTHTRTIGLVQKVSILKRADFILYNHASYVYLWLQVAGINHEMYTVPCP